MTSCRNNKDPSGDPTLDKQPVEHWGRDVLSTQGDNQEHI